MGRAARAQPQAPTTLATPPARSDSPGVVGPLAAATATGRGDSARPSPLFTPPPPVAAPVGTFPRSPTPFPLQPGRLGGPGRVTPPFSSLDGKNANVTQTLTEEDLLPARRARRRRCRPRCRAWLRLPPTEEGLTVVHDEVPGTEPQPDSDHKAVDEARMTFMEHLSDLRLRLRNAASSSWPRRSGGSSSSRPTSTGYPSRARRLHRGRSDAV